MRGKILAIAGSDSGGGAGIQADIKTINNLGCYATTAVTALTAQNSSEVRDILPIEPEFITKQIGAVAKDIKIDVVKIGMVPNLKSMLTIFETLKNYLKDIPIVLDPVMASTTGSDLAEINQDYIDHLKRDFIPECTVITPNLAEAEKICNMKIINLDDMVIATQMIKKMGAKSVLLKGGHLDSEIINDVLSSHKLLKIYESHKIDTLNTHGSGCVLASAISCNLAQNLSIDKSVEKARKYVYQALSNSIKPGAGNGTLNHFIKAT